MQINEDGVIRTKTEDPKGITRNEIGEALCPRQNRMYVVIWAITESYGLNNIRTTKGDVDFIIHKLA